NIEQHINRANPAYFFIGYPLPHSAIGEQNDNVEILSISFLILAKSRTFVNENTLYQLLL
ncbi:MAG: hypothetical protein J6O13_16795, partial [Selenomonas sp.]|nr:hypothetical protein [Selenomonas sp.]